MKSKNQYSRLSSKLFVFSFILTFIILVFIFWNLLQILMQNDANRTSRKFLQNLVVAVSQIEKETENYFDHDYYKKLHQQKLNYLKGDDLQYFEDYTKTLRQQLDNYFLRIALFTDCQKEDKVYCYFDERTIAKDSSSYYNPKSRPWYYNTRSHQSWVLSNEMISGDSRRHGYPGVWGILLTKHKTKNPDFVLMPDENGYYSNYENELETGIWISIFLSYAHDYSNLKYFDSKESSNKNFFKMLTKNVTDLSNLRVYFSTLKFPNNVKLLNAKQNISCESSVKFLTLTYDAKSFCSFYDDTIQFSFRKSYSNVFAIFALAFGFVTTFFILFKIFTKVFKMQQKAFQQKLLLENDKAGREMGARLVHDLKKGVLGKLNIFRFDYEKNWDDEIKSPDFLTHLKTSLDGHFQILTLLNRYIDHLMLSFQRKKEKQWREFSKDLIQDYGKWLDVKITWQKENLNKNEFLRMRYSAKNFEMIIFYTDKMPKFIVPEFAFFRIFKNLIDNFHAHGRQSLDFNWCHADSKIKVKVKNPCGQSNQKSSGLGLKIIKQILEDNFDKAVTVKSFTEESIYNLEMVFPIKHKKVKL